MNRISKLIIKKLQEDITPEELEELDRFAAESEENKLLVVKLTDHQTLLDDVKDSYRWYRKDDLRRIKRSFRWRRQSKWTAVTTLTIAVIFLLWRFFPGLKKNKNIMDIPMEVYNATLRTSETTVTDLSDFKNGTLPEYPSVRMSAMQLTYPVHQYVLSPGVDTLETHSKSMYSVCLPDSSIVWLNCVSTLRYPTSFSGTERIVHLEGEAYFEVAKDTRPFKVLVRGVEILVYGTKFTVRAYKKDDMVRTTLLEGSVKIKAQNKEESLKAGEQAIYNSTGQLTKTTAGINKETALAWKQNTFDWKNESFETIVADICNWYGLKPAFEGTGYSFPLTLNLNRSRPLNEILKHLEATAPVKFQTVDSTLIIGRL